MTISSTLHRWGLSLLMLLLPATLIARQSYTTSFAEARQTGKATIKALYFEQPHFSYTDDDGNPAGIAIDIFRQFTNYLKHHHKIETTISFEGTANFTGFMAEVKDGGEGLVGLGNITITDARKEEFRFSPAYFDNVSVLVTRMNAPTLSRLRRIGTDLENLTAVTVRNTTYEKYFLELKETHFPYLVIEYVDSDREIIEVVRRRPGKMAYVDYHQYHDFRGRLKRDKAADREGEEFGFIMPDGSDWQQAWRAFFAFNNGYRNSSLYRKIVAYHLGHEGADLLKKYYVQQDSDK